TRSAPPTPIARCPGRTATSRGRCASNAQETWTAPIRSGRCAPRTQEDARLARATRCAPQESGACPISCAGRETRRGPRRGRSSPGEDRPARRHVRLSYGACETREEPHRRAFAARIVCLTRAGEGVERLEERLFVTAAGRERHGERERCAASV